MFAKKKITKNSSIRLEKGRIHSGMHLVVFAIKIPPPPKKKKTKKCHPVVCNKSTHSSIDP